jgi:uroporphyrin-III C-methyltransferase/precorrin-2 dehydrogenase/sirohydrochlorin ferrochelatase
MNDGLLPAADREYFAAFLDLRGRSALVAGGGRVAAARAEALMRSGARVSVVAPELCPRLVELALLGALRHEPRRFQPGDLIGSAVAVAATDDPQANESVSIAARALGIPVNVADDARLSTFIMPAVIDRPPLQIAISSAGASPALARKLRLMIEAAVPHAFGRLAALLARFRNAAKRRLPDPAARRRFWDAVLDGPVADMALAGREKDAVKALRHELAGAPARRPLRGTVYLVGAGPGNPDLLTLRALRVLQQADAVLYDHLVPAAVLDLARRDAERIYVGKERDDHALEQREINALLARIAYEGRNVVRLKGGDPFIFGRGGEEIEALAADGVAFEVIPGITAASGVAAYAGIPLTHREHAQSCVFVTGHLKNGTLDLDWEALARPRQTVVIYMGVHGLAQACAQLVRHGLPAATPAAIVERGTMREQRVVAGTLATLPGLAAAATVRPPALVIVGEVVSLREKLGWFQPGTLDAAPLTARPRHAARIADR